jgi:hypothetical protein
MMILHLEEEGKVLEDTEEIHGAIYSYYKQLFGKQKERKVHLAEEVSSSTCRLSKEDNMMLMRSFIEEVVPRVVSDMKTNSAPGPDGFSSIFYKECWDLIKGDLMDL